MNLPHDLMARLRARAGQPGRSVDVTPGYVDPGAPLPSPPGGDALFNAEATMQVELPEEVYDLYTIADGGFGPGLGLHPIRVLVSMYQDLVRRGPDYTGELEWPGHFVPLFDAVMVPGLHGCDEARTLSIDTANGAIMTFNEDWDQDGISPEEAWTKAAPSLEVLLESWLSSEPPN